MNSWINFGAVGLIVGLSLLFGAGLPALFAVGLRALSAPGTKATLISTSASVRPLPARAGFTRIAVAILCFAAVLAAIAWGIYLIVAQS